MKKFIIPAVCVLSVTLFSFTEKTDSFNSGILEKQPDGNYLIIDGSKFTVEDIDLMQSVTSKDKKSGWNFIKFWKSKISKDTVDSLLNKETQPCDCDKDTTPSPAPEEALDYILAKYY
ncbi:hypothetical protein ABS768_01790 [Flavobacterium sp. ST-75]|uniref:Lipoprotein n=1 Tax=Flavobacterium rhizophilum TaxID=3163296 RepID=A0ABW8YA42_9FLAO